MKHYVAYHNAETMGYSGDEINSFSIVTNKPVLNLPGNVMWLISGEDRPRKYYLCSVFIVDEVGPVEGSSFRNFASGGEGVLFRPQIRLDEYPWFRSFLASQQNFSLGLREIREEKYIQEFENLLERVGETDFKKVTDPYDFILPEEIPDDGVLQEGSRQRVSVNVYERNPVARRRCMGHYGTNCVVCGLNFGKMYGEIGEGYIHVHHLRPLSEVGEEYQIDPINDLRPVCPNCHAMIHRRDPPYTVEEVRGFLSQSHSA